MGNHLPLHSVDMRAGAKEFSWLRRGSADYEHFMRDLTQMLTTIPVTALACVMDRPGYDERYRATYPPQTDSPVSRFQGRPAKFVTGLQGRASPDKRCN